MVKLFHDPLPVMVGVLPLFAQVALTAGFSEIPDSSS
jgi:hypothetical protein